ncbi:MAG: C1 family peptidase [Pseudomonadota bacterium]
MIVQAMLEQMGLDFPDQDKVDPPSPEPRPGPGPAPGPQPAPKPSDGEDDFFDDDFFDDDASFDDMVAEMDAEFEDTVKAWDEEYERTVARWDKARAEYLPKQAAYEAAAIPLEGADPSLQAATYASFRVDLDAMRPGEFHVLPNALNHAVKDQAQRGTCAAFSGVRSLEAIVIQQGVELDLSEEYFYFISKPSCQRAPFCGADNGGSTLVGGLLQSANQRFGAIPGEAFCPYSPRRDERNITNAPLENCPRDGFAKPSALQAVRSLPALLNALRNNQPVVAGFRLTPTYGRNKGLVRYHDPSNNVAAKGPHASGHANLLVGYIRLPDSMAREGRFCVITANSWGEGWGRGGFACLTETWLSNSNADFAAVQAVTVTDAGLQYYGLQ